MTLAPMRRRLPGYVLASLGGTWDVIPADGAKAAVSVSLRADNLLRQDYEETWGFSTPGRQLNVGLTGGAGGGS